MYDSAQMHTKENIKYQFSQTPHKIKLEDLSFDNARGRLSIIWGNIEFECCILPGNEQYMYTFLTANYTIKEDKSNYPQFNRTSWSEFLNWTCVYFDDPTKFYKGAGFYIFDKNINMLSYLSDIIKKIQLIYNIEPNNMYFLGSSAGGYAALLLSDDFKDSKAIALNPIISLPAYFQVYRINNNVKNKLNISFDDNFEDPFQRFDLRKRLLNENSTKILAFNTAAEIDKGQINTIKHILPNSNNIVNNIYKNTFILLLDIPADSPHATAMPDESLCILLLECLKSNTELRDNIIRSHLKVLQRYHKIIRNNNKLQIDLKYFQNCTKVFRTFLEKNCCMNYFFKNNYKTVAFYGGIKVCSCLIPFLQRHGIQVKYIMENTRGENDNIKYYSRAERNLPHVDVLIVADVVNTEKAVNTLKKESNLNIDTIFNIF